MPKVDIVLAGHLPAKPEKNLEALFNVHPLKTAPADSIRGVARVGHLDVTRAVLESLPKLEIIANFGVGYDGIDLKAAAERGVIVTNTPDVLTEEVADTTLGLLLMPYPLTGTLRDRTVGIAGLGRIGRAIARRLDAMQVPVVYHSRHPVPDVAYRYYADLRQMAAAVDTLVVVLPGTDATRNLINADILKALGADGILINIGRGVVVDEPALIAALKAGTIRAAGLDVFANEPQVPAELMTMDNVVLLPHVGSASVYTRDAMGQLVVDNLRNWFEKGAPLTAVPETPWPRKP